MRDMVKPEQGDPLYRGRLYPVIRGVIGFLVRNLTRLEVQGREQVPDQGPYILVANHLHWMDSPVIMTVLPHPARVFAGEKWAGRFLIGFLLKSVNSIFVNRGEVDRKALREALATIKAGGVLGMAPEGTRSKTGGLQRGRSGAAYLAFHSGATLVPVVCTGQQHTIPSLLHLRRARVRVVFGQPFKAPPVEGKVTTAHLDAFTEEIMHHLAALLPPEYRGVYADVPVVNHSLQGA
jgi:1-acyl-sn-glycerol-3-phosphate acyltransferase